MPEYQLAAEFRAAFPHMPRIIARRIAHYYLFHARPNNSAKGKPIGERIPNMAAAYVRHNFTGYDHLFQSGYSKPQARQAVQPEVSHYLHAWS